MNPRALSASVLACLAILATGSAAAADAYPSKPVKILFGFPPASATDFIARTVGDKLGQKWGQPVVIDNRPGAGGNLGSAIAAKEPNDGYTIFFGTVANAISTNFYSKLSYDYLKDFTPVTLVATTPLVLVVNPKLPIHNVKELVDYAKKRPGEVNFGSGGPGTSNHLAGEMFNSYTGVQMIHVPYKGTPAAYTDLLGGRIQIMFDNIAAVTPQVQSGKLRAIAVTSAKRAPSLPDVPTVAESIPGFEAVSWIGALVPVGTPKEIVAKIHKDLTDVLGMKDVQEKLASQGAIAQPTTPEQFDKWNRDEIAKWAKAIKTAGVKGD
ncbi:MAG TPA: tripartite tricarboxylate transporter substrate binding protein [Usitatibacter sp.]|nr:tripartite tricarboxylate transporter substrate binding protein [Usitatibacter sp.]